MEFTDALKQGNLEAVRRCPKADLHNHFVLGGSRRYLKEHTGRDIQTITKPLHSMDEMHAWNAQNIGDYFNSAEDVRRGVDVTIGSDDVLIFDSDVFKEYLRLYQCGCMSAEELDDIRENGLRKEN